LTVFGAGPAGEKFPSVSNYVQIAGNASATPPTIPNRAQPPRRPNAPTGSGQHERRHARARAERAGGGGTATTQVGGRRR